MEFLMNDPDVVKDRDSVPKPRLQHPTTPLSVKHPSSEDSFTQSDFEAALKKVSRKIEPSK
jgi:hypothetical protein